MMSERMVVSEDHLYELLSFLATSAHLCVHEPRYYGTFRLIDAASRLIGFALAGGQLEDDEFLRELKEDINKRKFLLMTDQETYFQLLEDATRKLAAELKRRAAVSEGGS
jgi:hypothetical protein